MKNLLHWPLLLFLWPLLAGSAVAQQAPDVEAAAFPTRALKIVVPFPAGGPSDVLARMIGRKMSEDWGRPVVIENRVGANTVIGAQAVQKAPADGYTMLMAIDSTLAMNQFLYRNLPYDPFTDFVPITLVAKTMMFIFVNAASELKSVDDLVAGAKMQPGKFSFGAGTITSKLMGHLVNKTIGMETLLISYNGSAEVTQGLLTRSVDFTYDGPSAAMPLVQGGQFRILAKFDNRPFPPAAHVPTFARALALSHFDEIKAKADAAGLFPVTMTPVEFAAFIRKEAERWAPIVKESGIRYD